MRLVPIGRYVAAVSRIWQRVRSRDSPAGLDNNATEAGKATWSSNVPSVFVSTEDPEALEAFRDAAPKTWRLFNDPLVSRARLQLQRRHARSLHLTFLTQHPTTVLPTLALRPPLLYSSYRWRRCAIDRRPRCPKCSRPPRPPPEQLVRPTVTRAGLLR